MATASLTADEVVILTTLREQGASRYRFLKERLNNNPIRILAAIDRLVEQRAIEAVRFGYDTHYRVVP